MTILEAIQSNPVFSDISEDTINSILISRSITGAADYNSSSLKSVDLASADLYYNIAVLPEFKEGQLSLKYNSDLLLKRAESIYKKYEDSKLDDFAPTKINVGVSRVQ